MRLLLLISSFFLLLNGNAQTPLPGGVDTASLRLWFRASSLPLGNVSTWATTVPSGSTRTYTLSKVDPTSTSFAVATNSMANRANNYNTVLNLRNNSPANNISLGNTTSLTPITWTGNGTINGAGTWIIVYYISPDDTLFAPLPATGRHILQHRESSSGGDGIQFRMLQTVNRFAVGSTNNTGAARDFKENFRPTIVTQRANYLTSGGGIKANLNGTSSNLTNASSASSGGAGLIIGCRRSTSATNFLEGTFNGDIAELMAFSTDLSDSNLVKIYSYLAIKNAITLSSDANALLGGTYLASNGTVLWNPTLGAAFNNEIVGIARDNKSGLLQKQSKTFNDSTRIYIGRLATSNIANTDNITSDTAYILLGSNTLPFFNATNSTEYPLGGGITSRVSKTWKLSNNNFIDKYSIDLLLDNRINITNADTANLVLITGTNSNLTSGVARTSANSGIVFTVEGNRLIISNINTSIFPINTTSFFTIASKNSTTTLPITDLTLKATLAADNTVKLNFVTVANSTYKNFEIQKSYDAINWISVSKLSVTNTLTDYSFATSIPEVKNVFYRIKGETFDNRFYYSNIQLLQPKKTKTEFIIFPNPAKNSIQITNIQSTPKSISIISAKGENLVALLSETNVSSNTIKINISTLQKGVYYVKINNTVSSFIKD